MKFKLELAKNPKTPGEILAKLATDSCEAVRRAVAENPNTPMAVLIEMSKDYDGIVREIVEKRFERSQML